MLLGFKTQINLNTTQKVSLAKHAGTVRDAYNWALALTKEILDYNKNNPNDKIKFPTAIELHKWLGAIRKVDKPWYYEVSKCAPQYALRQLREAWNRCFKKISGVPNFKKKGKHDSFTLDGSIKIVSSYKIQVTIIGVLKTYERLPQLDKIKSVTISRQADRWFIIFKIKTEELTNNNTSIVGVELGVKSLVTLSTKELITGTKSYRKAEKRLAKLQR